MTNQHSTTGEREEIARLFQGSAVKNDHGVFVEPFDGPTEDLEWEAWAFADTILSRPSRMAASSEGWVLVPAEPTGPMIDAPRRIILDDRMRDNNGRTKAGVAVDIYRAMLAARPDAGREVEPCFECGSTERIGTACKPCNPELAASTSPVAVPVSEELMKALAGFGDDYMTSEKHPPDYVLIPVAKFERICAALGLEVGTGPKTVMVRDTDSVCKTCRWRGDHAPNCVRKDEPWPMIEVSADSLEGRAALTAALAIPDKGVQGDQGAARSQPCADASALAPFTSPDGWVLVPAEATNDMMSAAIGQARDQLPHSSGQFGWAQARAAYSGFLGAAPDVSTTVAIADDWRSPDETPQVPVGSDAYFIVAVHRAHTGKVHTFPALYLNQMVLRFEDEEDRAVTGWQEAEANDDGDGSRYLPLAIGARDKLVGWRDMPKFTPRATASTTSASGNEQVAAEVVQPIRKALPQDVIDLVIAARVYAYETGDSEAYDAIDKALEAFASRVPWENEPEDASDSTVMGE
jgi:hypothetical protein